MDGFQEMSDVLKLLSDRSRLTILALLQVQDLCVCEIVDIMQMSQPNVSQHMRKLKAGGLVKESKRGQWVYYSLHTEGKSYVRELIAQLPSVQEKMNDLRLRERSC
jgi:ArsR family transcriptional regulator